MAKQRIFLNRGRSQRWLEKNDGILTSKKTGKKSLLIRPIRCDRDVKQGANKKRNESYEEHSAKFLA